MSYRNKQAIAAVLLIAIAAGAFILRSGGPATDAHEHGDGPGHGEHGPAHEQAAPQAAPPGDRGHAEHAPRALISDEQLRRNGIAIATAGPARIAATLELPGEVMLNPERSVVVTPRLAGVVQAVHVGAGERVRRGQVLAVVSSPALADRRADLLAGEKRLALARELHDREKRLWEDGISAQQDYLAARQALQEAEIGVERERQKLAALGAPAVAGTSGLALLEIRAPLAGTVVDQQISVGQALAEDAAVFRLADLSSVWVTLAVPAQDLARVQPGAPARVKAAALDAQASGRIAHVGALVGEQSRNASARLVLPNPQALWRPGLPVSVTLTHGEVDAAVAVAADAVQTLDGRPVVFVRRGQQFEAVPVRLGRTDGRHVEVVHGLAAGERYAATNSFVVKAELGKAEAGHDH